MALVRAKVRLFLLASFLGASSLTASYLLLVEQRQGTVPTRSTFPNRVDLKTSVDNALVDYIKSIFKQNTSIPEAVANSFVARIHSTRETIRTSSDIEDTSKNRIRLHAAFTTDVRIPRPTVPVYGDTRNCSKNPWRDTLIELFRAWNEMTGKYNIEYILACGSLLGALRNGDIIPWDSDIDVLVDKKFFPLLEQLSTERNFDPSGELVRLVVQPEFRQEVSETRRRFTCAGKETPVLVDQCSFQEPLGRLIKGNLHIDIYHFYHTANGHIKDPSEGTMKTYQKSDFLPFRPCMFLGMTAYCPNEPLKVLRAYFGTDNLEPPYKCKNGQWLSAEGRTPYK